MVISLSDITMSLEVLIGVASGAAFLICFTIVTVVCVVKKIKNPVQKTITPVQPFRPYEPVKKPEVRVRKIPVAKKQQTQSGVVRQIPPW